jgi:hypothetical protein
VTLTEILSNEELRRREFPVAGGKIFLAHAGVCPLPRRVADAISECARQATLGDQEAFMLNRLDEARKLASQLLNCQPDEIALVGPTSLALSFVAAGLNFRKGDNILIYHDDYPSNVYPWMALAKKGVEVRLLNTRGLGVIRPGRLTKTHGSSRWRPAISSAAFGLKLTPSENFCASAGFFSALTPSRRSARFRRRWNTLIFWPPILTNGCSARAAREFFTSGETFRKN